MPLPEENVKPMNCQIEISRNPRSARVAFAGARDGAALHGVTDGTWSLIDALRELLRICGPSHLTLATWTAAAADLREAERLLRARSLLGLRLIVDRSFQTRQPRYCALARSLFGDESIRIWNSHAKFAVLEGELLTALYLTSANLNRNPRVESFSLFFSRELAAEYLQVTEDLYRVQAPGEGFDFPASGREHTDQVMSALRGRDD